MKKNVNEFYHSITDSIDSGRIFNEISEKVSFDFSISEQPEGTGEKIKALQIESQISRNAKAFPNPYFKQWEGRIVAIEDDNYFTARINEINTKNLSKIVKFDRRKVCFENANQFALGASFYWKVGLFYESNGMAIKKSEIRFRLLPPPNPLLLKEAENEINKIFDSLTWTD